MMLELESELFGLDGIGDIIRCTQTATIGRWNILTNEPNFYGVLKRIKTKIPIWLNKFEDKTYNKPDTFPPICVTARVADDASLLGDGSFLSTSVISYGSFDTTGSFDLPPNHTNCSQSSRPTSYADAADTRS
jgi:hypothetical protein